MRSRCCVCVCVCLCIPLIVATQLLGKSLFIVARQRLGKNPLIVARQRVGKNPLIVARQRYSGKDTQAATEKLLDASFSMGPFRIKKSGRLVLPRTSCNITLPSIPSSPNWSISFKFSNLFRHLFRCSLREAVARTV
jgi:hypothetical protein